MSDTSPDIVAAATLDRVRAVIGELGQASAAAIGERAGLAYSTTTPKLRTLEDLGHAQRVRSEDNRTLWQLTDDGRLATADRMRDQTGWAGVAEPAPQEPGSPPTAATPAGDEAPSADASPPQAPVDASGDTTEEADDTTVGPAPAGTAADDSRLVVDTAPIPPDGDGAAATTPVDTGPARRAKGTLVGAVMDVLEADPGRAFKVSELCRRIDEANEGTDVRKASAGAVVLAAHRLVQAGRAVIANEKPLSFRLCRPL